MRVSDFRGGLNTYLAATKLQGAQAVYVTNADIASGLARSVPEAVPVTQTVGSAIAGPLFFLAYDQSKTLAPDIERQDNDVQVPGTVGERTNNLSITLKSDKLPRVTNLINLGPNTSDPATSNYVGQWTVGTAADLMIPNETGPYKITRAKVRYSPTSQSPTANIGQATQALPPQTRQGGYMILSLVPEGRSAFIVGSSDRINITTGLEAYWPFRPSSQESRQYTLVVTTQSGERNYYRINIGVYLPLGNNQHNVGAIAVPVDIINDDGSLDRTSLATILTQDGATVDIWKGWPQQNWSLTPPTTIQRTQGRTWVTFVNFDDDNNPLFSEPTDLTDQEVFPAPVSSITRPTVSVPRAGLPTESPNITSVNGYIYLNRLNRVLTGSETYGGLRMDGGVNADGEITYLQIYQNESQAMTRERFDGLLPGDTLTINIGQSNSLPAQIGTIVTVAGTRVIENVNNTQNNLLLIFTDEGRNLRDPTVFGLPIYLPTSAITGSIDKRLPVQPETAPNVSGGSYDITNDRFIFPIDDSDADKPNRWTRVPDPKEGFQLWRVGVHINDDGVVTFGTPSFSDSETFLYDGEAGNLSYVRHGNEVIPLTFPQSRDPTLQGGPGTGAFSLTIGDDITKTFTVGSEIYLKDGRWYFSNNERDYSEFRGELYFTQEGDAPSFVNSKEEIIPMGLPQVDLDNRSIPITITGEQIPTWNPVVRQMRIGYGEQNPFFGITYYQVVNYDFANRQGMDDTRLTRTYDNQPKQNEVYNNIIDWLPGIPPDGDGTIIENLKIVLNLTSDRTLIDVGNVYCTNFQFHTVLGAGGAHSHRRPTPVAIINDDLYYDMELIGGTFRAPLWRLGRRTGRPDPHFNNTTTTLNRLPRTIPAGNTHAIDWYSWAPPRHVSSSSPERFVFDPGTYNYRLSQFIDGKRIRDHDFTITVPPLATMQPPTATYTNTRSHIFIISDNQTITGVEYRLYRTFTVEGNQVYRRVDEGGEPTIIDGDIVNIRFRDTVKKTEANPTEEVVPSEALPDMALPTIINTGSSEYAITNVNETENIEGPPQILVPEVPLSGTNAFVKITGIPPDDTGRATHRYIYKIDSIHPNWGFIGKIKADATEFNDNVNFGQTSIYVYRRSQTPSVVPDVPERTEYTSGTREAGEWDGTRLAPPPGWSRQRDDAQGQGALYRSKVTVGSNTSGGNTVFFAQYSVPVPVEEGRVVRVGEALNSISNYEPPKNLRYLTLFGARMFGADGNNLHFSRIGRPHYWPRENVLQFVDPITGLLSVQGGLLIFTRHQTFVLAGNGPEDFIVRLVSAEQGCVSHATAVFVKSNPLWISENGIVTYLNGRIEVISREFIANDGSTNQLNWGAVKKAIYHQDIYYVLLSQFEKNELFRNKFLCLDMRYQPKIYMCDPVPSAFSDSRKTTIGSFDENRLFFAVQRADIDSYTLLEIGGPEPSRWVPMCWISPKYSDGTTTKLKVYDRIYITCKGALTIDIIIDGRVVDKCRVPPEGHYEELETYVARVPQGKCRGYTIQFSCKSDINNMQTELESISYSPQFEQLDPGDTQQQR